MRAIFRCAGGESRTVSLPDVSRLRKDGGMKLKSIPGWGRRLLEVMEETWRVQLWLWETYSDSVPGRRLRK